jgi:hypothetical protein
VQSQFGDGGVLHYQLDNEPGGELNE